ncbi:MAG: AGE family epimerase/isomerase [Candidatus Solibacter usitatus]|nr:AGE family epimerase/isomerase [Candidatus Solibacter usitatus]
MLDRARLLRLYRELLLDGIVPFWRRHGVDADFGGVLSSMGEDGEPISGDKFVWSQARWVWTCSALYNRIERRPEFLQWARQTIDFLLAHGRDSRGRWVYRTTREGEIVEGATSIYSDCFFVYGIGEYCRAQPDAALLQLARETLQRIVQRVEEPDFFETAPYALPANRRNHGVPMILTEVAGEFAETAGDAAIGGAAWEYAQRILRHFWKPDRGVILEFLDRQYNEVPPPEGTYVMPGHGIEFSWFLMHRALRRGDSHAIAQAALILRSILEQSWDPKFGGIYLGMDTEGRAPFLPHAETKIWWPHTEALYALLLAHKLTGEQWCADWYGRVHEWSFSHFPLSGAGEWRQRLDRRGNPVSTVVALPVKDPFHLPRAAILAVQLLAAHDLGNAAA